MTSRIGIIGTGYIARCLAILLNSYQDLVLSGMLTRRKGNIPELGFAQDLITNSPEQLMEQSDLIVAASGDPIYSTEIINTAFKYHLPVVTMESETQVTTGSWLSKRGFLSEAEGDQPGCLAALKEEVEGMGFQPVVYGNIKGYLNHNPTEEDMLYWSKRNGIQLEQTINFTDGTKLQIEQAHVANAFGVDIAQQGLTGTRSQDLDQGAKQLAEVAEKFGKPISDFIVSRNAPRGVFIIARHDRELKQFLEFWTLGKGPYYVLYKPVHLCAIEIPKTLRQVLHSKKILMNNGPDPQISVCGIAKKKLKIGQHIPKAIGSFEIRGEAMRVEDNVNHVPIGLMQNTVVKRNIEPGQIIEFDDLELPESLALSAWQETLSGFLKMKVNL